MNRTQISLALGSIVLLTGTLAITLPTQNPIPSKPVEINTATPPHSSTNRWGSNDEIASLRHELAALKTELAALKNQIAESNRAAKSPPPIASISQSLSPAEVEQAEESVRQLAEEANAGMQRQMEFIEAGFQAESLDVTWSEQTIAKIREAWSDIEPNDFRLVGLDCRSTMCRMEVQFGSEPGVIDSNLFAGLSPELPAVVQLPKTDSDDSTTVYYLARSSFPAPP